MEQLKVIRTLVEFKELKTYLEDKDFVSFDTETTGINPSDTIVGLSVSADIDVGFYVILHSWTGKELESLETLEYAREFLDYLKNKQLIMHNAVFDCSMVFNNFGIQLMPSLLFDTMIAGHLLDENRHNGLKELGISLFGEDAKLEQTLMKESVIKNGGKLTKETYELYKANADLLGKYGAKDAVLTYKLFLKFGNDLIDQGLDKFYYEDESLPLLKGPTYAMNTTGLRIDPAKLSLLKSELETQCLEDKAFVHREIEKHVKDKYPGTKKNNTFNIGSSKQLSWLLFFKLGNEFNALTKEGRNLCKGLGIKLPYAPKAKREFIQACIENKGRVYEEAKFNTKTKKMGRAKKVADPWVYIAADKPTLTKFSKKYKWVDKFLEYNKNLKLLNTYVIGIEERMKYNIIRPSFLQHGTTSGRYSSKNPNFQNLPRKDKRIKSCIISRPGKSFIGADYSQLEPRVFASFSQDEKLMSCFDKNEDFYSVIGAEVFEKHGCSLVKDDVNSFAELYPDLRDISKVVALSSTYGTTAPKMAPAINKEIYEAQEIIDNYFEKFPGVKQLMNDSHAIVKKEGRVVNLFGRPRRIPFATMIDKIYGKTPHESLPYEARNMLNLAVNHRIQSTGASIMNRAAIAFHNFVTLLSQEDPLWLEVIIVSQVHDELIIEAPDHLAEKASELLREAMENTTILPGVKLVAKPIIAKNFADLK